MFEFDQNLAPLEARVRKAREVEHHMTEVERATLSEAAACLERYHNNPKAQELIDANQWLMFINH